MGRSAACSERNWPLRARPGLEEDFLSDALNSRRRPQKKNDGEKKALWRHLDAQDGQHTADYANKMLKSCAGKQIVGSDCVNVDVRLIAGLALWVTSGRQWPRLEPLTHCLFLDIMDSVTLGERGLFFYFSRDHVLF